MALRRPSAREVIERTNGVGRLDMFWAKKMFGRLREAAKNRTEHGVDNTPLEPDDKFLIHTHGDAQEDGWVYACRALPSAKDISAYLTILQDRLSSAAKMKEFSRAVIPAVVIASVSKDGKLMGYTVLEPKKQLADRMKGRNFREWREIKELEAMQGDGGDEPINRMLFLKKIVFSPAF